MTPKEKAIELLNKFESISGHKRFSKAYALIAVENEYNSNREILFNLRACKVIESEKVYLTRIQELIDEEKEVKQELEKL